MDLQEEYYLRNKVEKPLVRFCPQTFVILEHPSRIQLEKRYELFSSSLVNKEGVPGTFEVRTYYPTRNNYKDASRRLTAMSDNKVTWEDYEDWVLNWVQGCRIVDPQVRFVSFEDVKLALWDIFLVSHDSLFGEIQTIAFRLIEETVATLDYKLDKLERMQKIEKVIQAFNHYQSRIGTSQFKVLVSGWQTYLSQYAHPGTYGNWLVNLSLMS